MVFLKELLELNEANVDPILTKIHDAVTSMGVKAKLEDIRAIFVGGSSAGMTKVIDQLEERGFDSAGTFADNTEFFKKCKVTKTDYDKLVKASL